MSADNVDMGFDPSLKKKKKKSSKLSPSPVADVEKSSNIHDDNDDDNDEVEDIDTTASGEIQSKSQKEATPEVDDVLSTLKKKKKKSKPLGDIDSVDASSSKTKSKSKSATSGDVDDITDALGGLKLKKKKKKAVTSSTVDDFEKQLEKAGVLDTAPAEESTETAVKTDQSQYGLSYDDLLTRFFQVLRANNPELAGERSGSKFRIPPPICQREGNKKTAFANVQEISGKLQRTSEHVIQYLFAELGTSGSVDGQKRLIIKGRFMPKQLEKVLRGYIQEYVSCKTCKSMNTQLKKESSNRLSFLVCNSCGSTRSVTSIKTGFQAHIGKRKKMA